MSDERAAKVERAAAAVHHGILFVKLGVWTAFALAGPIAFLMMRNYLGVTVTGGIGIFIGLAIGDMDAKGRALAALRVVRAVLCLQGLLLGGYGAYKLSRPADPWKHAVGRTRAALTLASTGKVYALEFTESSAGFFIRDESGEWRRDTFPGFLASTIAIGPGDAVVFANEDRALRIWIFGPEEDWERRPGFGFPSSLASSDRALFITARGSLHRIDKPNAEARPVPGVEGGASVVCTRGNLVLAIKPKREGQAGRVWRSTDGGTSFSDVRGASLAASLCGIANDGSVWVAAEGTFSGELSVAAPNAGFAKKTLPAPRVEAIAVNPTDGREAWVGAWGAGVYRSLDGGESWSLVGLEGFEVSDLVVDFVRHRAYAGAGSGVYELAF